MKTSAERDLCEKAALKPLKASLETEKREVEDQLERERTFGLEKQPQASYGARRNVLFAVRLWPTPDGLRTEPATGDGTGARVDGDAFNQAADHSSS